MKYLIIALFLTGCFCDETKTVKYYNDGLREIYERKELCKEIQNRINAPKDFRSFTVYSDHEECRLQVVGFNGDSYLHSFYGRDLYIVKLAMDLQKAATEQGQLKCKANQIMKYVGEKVRCVNE